MSSKNPTIKRILKEASELANQPSSEYHAAPLETDLFEWHFTIRGPPKPSPFDGGIYHGRIVLPPAYPLKPPSFRFLTATGRFEVNREICLSISGHHEETWQPAWGIRTALVAIRSFMDTEAAGQVGGMDLSNEVRKRFAAQSKSFKCSQCNKGNEEIMKEQDTAVADHGGDDKTAEVVPEELRLAYREDLGSAGTPKTSTATSGIQATPRTATPISAASTPVPVRTNSTTPQAQSQQIRRPPAQVEEAYPPWIDTAIYIILGLLAALVAKRILL